MKNFFKKVFEFVKNNLVFSILLVLVLLCTFVRLPYEVEMPGGVIDLGNRVKVNGEEVSIKGSFNMAYVSVAQGSIPHIIAALIIPDWEIVPQDEVKLENETIEDANRRDRLRLEESKDNATIAALTAAGIEYEKVNETHYVAYISRDAKTDIKVGDYITKCNGEKFVNLKKFKEMVQNYEVGDKINFVVMRSGKEVETYGTVYEEEDTKYVGLSILTTFDIKSSVNIEISSRSTESGPSGGLMMALMIYNAITKQDLTHGLKIVGTGAINEDGTVEEIGGIKYKVMGAAKHKADIFFVPEANYEDAVEVKEKKNYKMEIVKVATLQDAIDYLEKLK